MQINNLFLNTTKTGVVLVWNGWEASTRWKFPSYNWTWLTRESDEVQMSKTCPWRYNHSWKSHVKYIVSKAVKRLLGRIWEDLKTNASNIIFKTFILPILDHCDLVWARCNKQHRCIWTIAESGRYKTMMNSTCSDSPIAYHKWGSLYSRCHKHILSNSSNTSNCSPSDF